MSRVSVDEPPGATCNSATCSASQPAWDEKKRFSTDSAQPSLDPMVSSFYWAACARFLHAAVAVAQYRMRKKKP